MKKGSFCDALNLLGLCLVSLCALELTAGYIVLGTVEGALTMLIVEALFVLTALAAWRGRVPLLHVLTAVFGFVLGANLNYAETTAYNAGCWVEGAAGVLCAVGGTAAMLYHKEKPRLFPLRESIAFLLILAASLSLWGGFTAADKNATGLARRALWAVPTQFDATPCAAGGTIEELTYETRAYATDGRTVTKRCLVYLPHGYDGTTPYNILYLLHGTGDDENYWLETNPKNKIMVDNLIASGQIAPLIIVTPTFYVEDDCMDGLDALTWSFREELRGDLMPAVESRYRTYAATPDAAGFTASREHRAFAGLSRGAVTTYHSALCGSLDFFAWFGTFSGSRTDAETFAQTLRAPEFADYSIRYLYVTSGTFDFALPRQLQDNAALLRDEPRLVTGVNTDVDIFPMRYHAQGNWHLALYNFLQRVF